MKKMTKTNTKTRMYTIQVLDGVPSLRIRGKFLANDFGVDVGTQLQLIEGKNMLVLLKVPAAVTARTQTLHQLRIAEEEAEYLRSTL